MDQGIHVRLESLTGEAYVAATPSADGGQGSFYIETFGCQMNDHDSEKVAGVLLRRGYRQASSPADAKLVLYNTCSIRDKAEQKVFSRLGLFNPKNNIIDPSNKIIGVLGCVAQQEGERIFDRAPWVSLVCGSASYSKLPALLAQLESGERHVAGLDTDTEETFETEMTRRDSPMRAYVTIIEGCDRTCTYCVVPRTRGPERSRNSDAILREVRELADVGYTEVQLLGQTVNSYRDPTAKGMRFADLLAAVAETPGIRRVRFTTSHPDDLDAATITAMDTIPQLCEHLHLPVQSGSTSILRSMQRTYTREEYLAKIEMVRAARRPISITTDVIVGFPGETEEDFHATLSLLDQVQFEGIFAFQYSPRPHTPAATMADAVPEEEKSRRLAMLLEKQRLIQTAQNDKLIGKRFEVLVEGASRHLNQWSGRTSGNRTLNFTSSRSALLGEYVVVTVTHAGSNSLVGVEAHGTVLGDG